MWKRLVVSISFLLIWATWAIEGQYTECDGCEDLNLPSCDWRPEGGALNPNASANASCLYRLCLNESAVVDIPVPLLDGYRELWITPISLVTKDNCSIEELKFADGSSSFIRLTVPYNGCNTTAKVAESKVIYSNDLFFSYVGNDWKLYFLSTSCEQNLDGTSRQCHHNHCHNGATCTISEGIKCLCTAGYTGPYCGEQILPENGIYEMEAPGVDLSRLFEMPMECTEYTSSFDDQIPSTLVFEVVRFGNLHSLRLLSLCPHHPRCYGSLSRSDHGRVMIAGPQKGISLVHMVRGNDGFSFGFDKVGSSVSYSYYQNLGFYLAPNGPETVEFKLKRLSGIEDSPLPQKIELLRRKINGYTDMIAMPLTGESCSLQKVKTFCLWFQSFEGYIENHVIPLSFWDGSKSDIMRVFNRDTQQDTAGAMLYPFVNHLGVAVGFDHTMSIYLSNGDNIEIASTESIRIPHNRFRHHLCVTSDMIMLDGAPLRLKFKKAGSEDEEWISRSTFVVAKNFIGQIDGLDVWCDKKSNAFLFRESTVLPECKISFGDVASLQKGDLIATRNVEEETILTQESACKFCPEGWITGHGSCFSMLDQKTTPENRSSLRMDLSERCLESSPASISSRYEHNTVAKYVDAVLGKATQTSLFGHEPTKGRGFRNFDQNPTKQPVCGLYVPTESREPWHPMPPTSYMTPGASSLHNYQWGSSECTDNSQPLLCEQSITSLNPSMEIVLRVFMLGGYTVSQKSKPEQLRHLRTALQSAVKLITARALGKINFEFIDLGRALVKSEFTDSGDMILKIKGWKPFVGNPKLDDAIRYINDNYNRSLRYINILTSAYDQTNEIAISKQEISATFALGFMDATAQNLELMAYPKSCYGFAEAHSSIPRKIFACATGMVITDASFSSNGISTAQEDSQPGGRSLRHLEFVEGDLHKQYNAYSYQNIRKSVLNLLSQKLRNKAYEDGATRFQSLRTRTKRHSANDSDSVPEALLMDVSTEMSAGIKRSISKSQFQVVRVQEHYALRNLIGCPEGEYCLWWLGKLGEKVEFFNPSSGYDLWDLIPVGEADQYRLKFVPNGKFLQSSSSRFYLSKNETSAITLVLNVPEIPTITCDDKSLSIEVGARSLLTPSDALNKHKLQHDVLIYVNDPEPTCSVLVAGNATLDSRYRLAILKPFTGCGLSVRTDDLNVSISGVLYYEETNGMAFADRAVMLSNFTCTYRTRLAIGLQPDKVLAVDFKVGPNNKYSREVVKHGKIDVILSLYSDANHSTVLPPNPNLKVGSFLYASYHVQSEFPVISLHIERCYLSPFANSEIQSSVVEIVKENCLVSNDLPKSMELEKRKVSFMFQVFQWKYHEPRIFLHCLTKICDTLNSSSCATDCSSKSRIRRLASSSDHIYASTKVLSVYGSTRSSALDVSTGTHSSLLPSNSADIRQSQSEVKSTTDHLYVYYLAGLILFAFMFFVTVVVVLLHHFRLPSPKKYALHARRGYLKAPSVHTITPPKTCSSHFQSMPENLKQNLSGDRLRNPYPSDMRFSTFLGNSAKSSHSTNQALTG